MSKKFDVDFAKLDFVDVMFPSDKLTIAALRRINWEWFDDGFHVDSMMQPQFFFNGDHGRHAADVIGNMLFCERAVVACAFADQVGGQRPDCEIASARKELLRLYPKFGLAKGKPDARILVKALENAGREMASTGGPWGYKPNAG